MILHSSLGDASASCLIYFSLRLKVTEDSDERVFLKYLLCAAHSLWIDNSENEEKHKVKRADYADAVHTLKRISDLSTNYELSIVLLIIFVCSTILLLLLFIFTIKKNLIYI